MQIAIVSSQQFISSNIDELIIVGKVENTPALPLAVRATHIFVRVPSYGVVKWGYVVVGVSRLWPLPERSRKKRKWANDLISMSVNNIINRWIDKWIRGWVGSLSDGRRALYKCSSTKPSKGTSYRPNNHYQSPANLLPSPFGSPLSASPKAGLLIPNLAYASTPSHSQLSRANSFLHQPSWVSINTTNCKWCC